MSDTGTLGAILGREGITRFHEENFNDFLAHPPAEASDYSFRMTSGTTGAPLFVVRQFTYHPNELIRGAKSLLLCHASHNVNMGNVQYVRIAPHAAKRVCAVTPADLERAPVLLEDFLPDSIYGTPSFVERFLQSCAAVVRRAVLQLGFNGEPVTDALEERMHALCPGASVSSVYIASETGPISVAPCGHLPRGRYHPKEGVAVDINEPDEMGVGDLLISTQFSATRRIERYRIGDLGRMRSEQCPCGAAVTFEIVGRKGYDYVKAGGGIFHRAEFDRVAAECKELFDDYQIEVSPAGQSTRVLLRVYRRDGFWSEVLRQQIAAGMGAAFITITQTLSERLSQGFSLDIEAVTAPFERKAKDVKIIHRV